MEQEREQKIQEEQILKSMSSNSNFSENTIEHAMTLDTVLQQQQTTTAYSVNHMIWIKIDVEGAELDVLKGATKTLAANQNITILVEIHRSWLYEPLLNLLRKYDFRLQAEHIYGGDNVFAHILVSKGYNIYNSSNLEKN